jgi:hypothetical protein
MVFAIADLIGNLYEAFGETSRMGKDSVGVVL